MPNLLHPNLTFNRSAIMAEAVVIARRELAALRRQFPAERHTWQRAMAHGLRRAWQGAKGKRMNALWQIEQNAEAAMLSTKERAIADLQDALAAADMIDNTARCLATKAAIEAKIHQLRA